MSVVPGLLLPDPCSNAAVCDCPLVRLLSGGGVLISRGLGPSVYTTCVCWEARESRVRQRSAPLRPASRGPGGAQNPLHTSALTGPGTCQRWTLHARAAPKPASRRRPAAGRAEEGFPVNFLDIPGSTTVFCCNQVLYTEHWSTTGIPRPGVGVRECASCGKGNCSGRVAAWTELL